jgi:hypothetical protein
MDHPELQDNPRVWWNTELIESIVHEHVKKWQIDAVGSFFPRLHASDSKPADPQPDHR